MIDLKRDSKTGELKKATGLNSHKWRCYKPGQKEDFPISRSRFEDFTKCPKCFYIRLVKCLKEPDGPPFKLNELTDTLLKKEFDDCRKKQKPHRLLVKEKLKHIVPYDAGSKIIEDSKKNKKKWEIIDVWRDAQHKGINSRFKDTNIILQGGIDDIWFDTKKKELIIVDYKSQASKDEVSQNMYFKKPYRKSYQTQLDFYAYVMKGMELEFPISKDSYLYVVNGLEVDEGFNGKISFSETLIRHEVNTDYLDDEIQKMVDTINSTNIPDSHESCNNCAYTDRRNEIE